MYAAHLWQIQVTMAMRTVEHRRHCIQQAMAALAQLSRGQWRRARRGDSAFLAVRRAALFVGPRPWRAETRQPCTP